MKDEDKQYLVEKMGLCWHDWTNHHSEIIEGHEFSIELCIKCQERVFTSDIHQLDPLDPADMYGKIWVAFREKEDECREFLEWLNPEIGAGGYYFLKDCQIDVQYLHAPDLADAMLEYIKEKEDA